jgi:predicted RNase H-like HicB family nuclease
VKRAHFALAKSPRAGLQVYPRQDATSKVLRILATRSEEVAVSLLSRKKQSPSLSIFVLVRFWPEDGVWNASAMDIPVVVCGNSFEDAQNNFEQALMAHFETLADVNQVKKTINRLTKAAKDRGFYDRIRPRETFEKFPVRLDSLELCHA